MLDKIKSSWNKHKIYKYHIDAKGAYVEQILHAIEEEEKIEPIFEGEMVFASVNNNNNNNNLPEGHKKKKKEDNL